MDQQNRLLAMLKSATTVPSPPPSSSSQPSPQVQIQQQGPGSSTSSLSHSQSSLSHSHTHLSVPGASAGASAGSPREPSPSPPPPSLQAVSLSDLFKSISSPPPPASTSGLGPASEGNPLPSASPHTLFDQKNKLLGMLNTIGQPPSTASGVSSPSHSSVQSPVGGPEKIDPLSIFRAGHPSTINPPSPTGQGPVIGHPTGHITSPPTEALPKLPSIPTIQAQHTGTSTTSSQAKKNDSNSAPSAAPVMTGTDGTPKKSMFDFVSPFDAFEQPKSRQPSSSHPNGSRPQPQSQTQPQAATPAQVQNPTALKDAKLKSVEAEHGLEKVKSIDNLQSGRGSPQRAQQISPAPFAQSSSVQELPEEDINAELEKTWQIKKVVRDADGTGPQPLSLHTKIDLSKPNLESLVSTPDAVRIVPATLMRTDSLQFRKGRRVATTNKFIAYTMSKGRVRLIDSQSGSRLVLQLPASAALGPVIDFAVSGTLVATIAHDRTVCVHRVPEGWQKDDPKVSTIFICSSAGGPVGEPYKVEWVKKEGKDFLAVGGPAGVVVLDPTAYGTGSETHQMKRLSEDLKLLRAEGSLVDFCLNNSHQAIGLLSDSSHCTLYNVSNLNRVWHRPLPSANNKLEPSSVQFCESNILVGRGNNTHFDLIQITVDVASLASITFVSPSPAPKNLHHAQAVYDPSTSIFFVAPFSRGSIYAFKYALKGQQPVKGANKPDGPFVLGFDRIAEFPFEPVLSLVSAKKGANEDVELFFATPSGFSQATISKSTCDLLSRPLPAQHEREREVTQQTVLPIVSDSLKSPKPSSKIDLPEPVRKTKTGSASKPVSKNVSPVVVKTELPSASDEEGGVPQPKGKGQQARKGSVTAATEAADVGGVITQDEMNKALKKTEDRLSNHLKQTLKNELAALNVRLDGLTGPDFASDISARVEKQIKGSLTNVITQEMKKSVLPSITTTIQNEVRTVAGNQVPAAIFDALQTVPKELERGLAPLVQRTISGLVQNTMDKAIHESIQHTLLPAMTKANTGLVEQLTSEMRSEMLQIGKELSPPNREGQLANDHLIKSMATSIAELQKQLASLSEQIRSAPPPTPASAPAHGPSASISGPSGVQQSSHPNGSSAPHAQPAQPPAPHGPSPSQLEDTFLTALGAQTTASTLQLVGDHLSLTEYCLPLHGKSPLSQAVLLTLLHRLAIALSELGPGHPMFVQVAGWERRTVGLVDPKDANIAGYISRVLSVVQGLLAQVLSNLQRYQADPNTQNHVNIIRSILDVIAHKMV